MNKELKRLSDLEKLVDFVISVCDKIKKFQIQEIYLETGFVRQ